MNKSLIKTKTIRLLQNVDFPDKLIKGLQELLKSYVDEQATENYQRIIIDTGSFYGVPKPILWIIATEIGKFIQKDSSKAEGLLKTLWGEGSYEVKQIVAKSLEKFGPKHTTICLDFVSSVLHDLNNWSVCDVLAMSGVRPIVYSNPEIVLPLSEKWIKNSNKWIRRFGVVSLLGYKKIKTTNKVFEILDLVMDDYEMDVKKAVSWILRDITKKNPFEVDNFLTKWSKANPSKNVRWIIKYGMVKLPEEKQTEILAILSR